MNIEVLLSCMNQYDLSIVSTNRNIKSDVVIVNQCDENSYVEKQINGNKIKMICSEQRGLSRSRNFALINATAEICMLCDDDVVYVDNYDKIVLDAFRNLEDADIIVFNIERTNYERYIKPISNVRKSPGYKSYGSVRIAFKLKSVQQNNIWFNVNFGAGSIYGSGEESLMLWEAKKKGLIIYEYPATIAKVDFSNSTWFEGYNEKFFYDKGALLSAAYPIKKYLFMFYYVMILRNSTKLSTLNMFRWITRGMKGYKNFRSYDIYVSKKMYK